MITLSFNILIWHSRPSEPSLHEGFQLQYTYVFPVIPMRARWPTHACVLHVSLFLPSTWHAYFTPIYRIAAYFCSTVNANCGVNHWLNRQADPHKHNMICKTIRSYGPRAGISIHTTGLMWGGGQVGANAPPIFFLHKNSFFLLLSWRGANK
jgi:hypothetical protein